MDATADSTTQPSTQATAQPSTQPTARPSTQPTAEPSTEPIPLPINQPSTEPLPLPINQPSTEPIPLPITQQPRRRRPDDIMGINKRLATIKAHYFFYNSGTAPVVPYMTSYVRQLGVDATTVGYIYTGLPFLGLIVKPAFGAIADKFNIHKSLFIFFQVLTIISFTLIYFIPSSVGQMRVELDCANDAMNVKTCYSNNSLINSCFLEQLALIDLNETMDCDMQCTITSPMMWKVMCKQWRLPQYCTGKTKNMDYPVDISKISMVDGCALMTTSSITLSDDRKYNSTCKTGINHVDVEMHCKLRCSNRALASKLDTAVTKMKCVDEAIHYEYCAADAQELADTKAVDVWEGQCMAACTLDVDEPWQLMQICQNFDHSAIDVCLPEFDDLPESHSFVAQMRPSTVHAQDECIYMEMNTLTMADGVKRYPYCKADPEYIMGADYYHAACEINCNHPLLNQLIGSAEQSFESKYHQTYWQFELLVACLAFSWMGQAVVVTFADAICFNMLGKNPKKFGEQRLWGSFGWGIFSLLAGVAIDYTSDGTYKNYAAAFILMFVFLFADVVVSCFMKTESPAIAASMFTDMKVLFRSPETHMFWLWCIATGACMGLLWQFLFWHVEDLYGVSCKGSGYVKTLQGLISAIQMFGGEVPFLYVSGSIIDKLGHANTMSLVIICFGLRFILYSSISNPWLMLPIEILHGVTVGMMYPVMASYANKIAPPGTEATVQGLVGAMFEGVGSSLGSFFGGQLYEAHSGAVTFRLYGVAAIIFGVVHILFHLGLKRYRQNAANQKDEILAPVAVSQTGVWVTGDAPIVLALPAIPVAPNRDETPAC